LEQNTHDGERKNKKGNWRPIDFIAKTREREEKKMRETRVSFLSQSFIFSHYQRSLYPAAGGRYLSYYYIAGDYPLRISKQYEKAKHVVRTILSI